MARWYEPTPEQVKLFDEWVAERPKSVQDFCERFPPWELYRIKSTGHRVIVYSIGQVITEDGEPTGKIVVTVDVLGKFNFVLMERRVFGIDPDDLEPSELPADGELTGSLEIPIELLKKREKIEEDS